MHDSGCKRRTTTPTSYATDNMRPLFAVFLRVMGCMDGFGPTSQRMHGAGGTGFEDEIETTAAHPH